MHNIETRIKEYIDNASTIKADWYNFVINDEFPVDERWRIFLLAPTDWKEVVSDSDVPLEAARHIFDSPYDDFNVDRGQTRKIDRIIEILHDKAISGKHAFTQVDLHACMEEAMIRCLGGWRWDW